MTLHCLTSFLQTSHKARCSQQIRVWALRFIFLIRKKKMTSLIPRKEGDESARGGHRVHVCIFWGRGWSNKQQRGWDWDWASNQTWLSWGRSFVRASLRSRDGQMWLWLATETAHIQRFKKKKKSHCDLKKFKMTVLKDIPEKWFPVVLFPLQGKKKRGLDGRKSKKRRTGTSLCGEN